MNECLSEFALDDYAVHGRASPTVVAHLSSCQACRVRIDGRQARVNEFQATLAAPTWTRIRAEAATRGRARTRALPWAAVAAAAAALLLFIIVPRRSPHESGPTPKGSSLAEIVCRRGERTFVLGSGDEVAPGDRLRFRPLPIWPQARYIQVGSVDGTGGYSPFYPAGDGVSVALPARGAPLEGSIRLDDAPGPERLFVVLSATPLSTRDVQQAAQAHAADGERVVRIGGAAVATAWIVLPKRGGSSAAP
jgi:hypothetical protein